MNHYNFKPGCVPALATALLFPLFIALGIWQLHRAEAKEALIALRAARDDGPEFALGERNFPDLDQIRFRHATAEGRYDAERQILLDNQIVDHQAGYFVLTPLKLQGGELGILVNRGWVPAGPDRSKLPDVTMTRHRLRVHGIIDKFPSVGWRLRGAEIPTPGAPAVVQLLDARALSQHIGYPILPYQVLLNADEPEGYIRAWKSADPDPGKNRGYALQWFSFATILIVLFVWFGFKPKAASSR